MVILEHHQNKYNNIPPPLVSRFAHLEKLKELSHGILSYSGHIQNYL